MSTPRSVRAAVAASVILAALASAAPVAAQDPSVSPAASPAASAAPRTFGEAWTPAGCADLGLLADFDQIADCGYVTVPESRAAGTSDTIKLGVMRIRATSGTSLTPIVKGAGGPGADGLANATPAWVGANAAILKDHDVVLFTQRGTNGAQPHLDCPGYSMRELNTATQASRPTRAVRAGAPRSRPASPTSRHKA